MWHFRRIKGDNMLPTLKDGQTIIVSSSRSFSIGDIVVAFMDRREVIKRIVEMKDGKVLLEDDNKSHASDSWAQGWLIDRHVVGKVVFPLK